MFVAVLWANEPPGGARALGDPGLAELQGTWEVVAGGTTPAERAHWTFKGDKLTTGPAPLPNQPPPAANLFGTVKADAQRAPRWLDVHTEKLGVAQCIYR